MALRFLALTLTCEKITMLVQHRVCNEQRCECLTLEFHERKEKLRRSKLIQYALGVGVAVFIFIATVITEGLTRATLFVGQTVIGLGLFFAFAVAWVELKPIDRFHNWRFERYMTKLKGKDWENCYGERCSCKHGKPHGWEETTNA